MGNMVNNMKIDFQDSEIQLEVEDISVEEMLKQLDINPVEVVVTQNGRIVLESSILQRGDEVKIIQVIHGG
jgi:sulfur carrier protein